MLGCCVRLPFRTPSSPLPVVTGHGLWLCAEEWALLDDTPLQQLLSKPGDRQHPKDSPLRHILSIGMLRKQEVRSQSKRFKCLYLTGRPESRSLCGWGYWKGGEIQGSYPGTWGSDHRDSVPHCRCRSPFQWTASLYVDKNESCLLIYTIFTQQCDLATLTLTWITGQGSFQADLGRVAEWSRWPPPFGLTEPAFGFLRD